MQEVNSTQGRGKGPKPWQRAHASQDPSQKQFPAGSVLVLSQPTVLRRVKGQREEFLQLTDPQRRRREEGSRATGSASWEEEGVAGKEEARWRPIKTWQGQGGPKRAPPLSLHGLRAPLPQCLGSTKLQTASGLYGYILSALARTL